MKYNLKAIMGRAWGLYRTTRHSFRTCLRLAWAEAKGLKAYTFNMENARASISAYLVKLAAALVDIHQQHKYDALRAALLAPVDALGIAVLDGKTVGLCKYAVRNA